jgi:hypothetical protein
MLVVPTIAIPLAIKATQQIWGFVCGAAVAPEGAGRETSTTPEISAATNFTVPNVT